MAEEKKEIEKVQSSTKQIAVIRIRGSNKMKQVMDDTLTMLKLYNQHNCVILKLTPSIKGMIKKVEPYITWGEVSDETVKLLKDKKGDIVPFRLNPPVKGFERKGIKMPFAKGGALGYRGEKVNDLIKRMI